MKYTYSIILDAIIASFLFIGITQNIEGFVNVGYFAGWFFGVIKFLAYLFSRDTLAKEYKHVPTAFRYYDLLTDTAFVIFVVYQGWFVLGAIYAIGAMAKVEFQGKQEKMLSTK
ncbi:MULTISPECIES: hypothetical protein [unclassified Photorhabdus]|uniref:hypothetical protein n=2 Tax=Photorhabdus TaxID=29487 RepID=UPI000DCE06B1|nr:MULTISPECIES: hypothetical protein [unclassified Photorhabdus]RAW91452.1 hypothetical protein CKY03_24030 [Photorhabdus sp. S9-53]RAW91457.1 hypothetical protein CKY05_24010 [Photorhabdus sp. S10-54]RAW95337.1 hypothetical protein CKY04_23880 [Photorhabdus sp. S8-52]